MSLLDKLKSLLTSNPSIREQAAQGPRVPYKNGLYAGPYQQNPTQGAVVQPKLVPTDYQSEANGQAPQYTPPADTSYAYSDKQRQQTQDNRSVLDKAKDFLVNNTAEGTFAKGIANILPGADEESKNAVKSSTDAANLATETIRRLKAGEISTAQAKSILLNATSQADAAVKTQKDYESSLPTRTQIAAGAAGTAADLVGGIVQKPLAAVGLGAASGGLTSAATGGDAKDIAKSAALGGALTGALAGAGAILSKVVARTKLPQDIVEHVINSGDQNAIKSLAQESGVPEADLRNLAKPVDKPVETVDNAVNDITPTHPAAAQEAAPAVEANPQAAVAASSPTGDVPVRTVSDGVKASLNDVLNHVNTEGVKARAETKVLYRNERADRAAAFEEALANGEGDDAWKAAMGKMKGELPKGSYTPLPISAEGRAQVDSFVKTLPGAYNKINLNNALRRVFGEEQGIPTPSDIRYIREAFGDAFADKINDHVAASKGWRDVVSEIISTPKAALATGDLSASLRQGGVLGTRFPKEWAAATKDMTRYAFSGKAYDSGMREIADRPTYELMEKAKLAVDGARGLKGTEEEFRPSLLERKWLKKIGIGHITEGSDRAYSGFLTKFRADAFDTMVDKFRASGIELDDKQLKAMGKFINTATGRGDLGSLERHAGLLSQALFSPRLWKSRIDLLNPVYYAKLTPEVRKYALQSTGNFLGAAGAVLGLASAAGASVSWDPRSADFAKIKVGNTRYDIMGGLQQNIVIAYRLLSGQKTNSENGEVATLGPDKGFGKPDRFDLLVDFFLNKANPTVSYGVKMLKGEGPDGKPYNPASELAKTVIPLNAQSVYETSKDTGNVGKATAMNIPSFLGIGVNTYGLTPTKDAGKAPTDLAGKIEQGTKDKSKAKQDFLSGLSADEQTLIKQSPESLTKLRDNGTIDDATFNQALALKKAQSNLVDGVKNPPANLKTDDAKSWYKTYNSLTKAGQESFLKRSSPQADRMIKSINQQRPTGLPELKPSNKLAKLYADFEGAINKPDITSVEKNNKVKTFYSDAVKSGYSEGVQKLFAEGGSADTKGLLADGTVTPEDLDQAVEIDNALFNGGISRSLKFSKDFRKTYGYGLPEGNDRAGTKGSLTDGGGKAKKEKVVNAHLADFLSSAGTKSKALPRFSPADRKNVALKLPGLPSAPGKPKISIKL